MWLYNPNGFFFKRKIRESEVWEQTGSRGREDRAGSLGMFWRWRWPWWPGQRGGSTPSVAAR